MSLEGSPILPDYCEPDDLKYEIVITPPGATKPNQNITKKFRELFDDQQFYQDQIQKNSAKATRLKARMLQLKKDARIIALQSKSDQPDEKAKKLKEEANILKPVIAALEHPGGIIQQQLKEVNREIVKLQRSIGPKKITRTHIPIVPRFIGQLDKRQHSSQAWKSLNPFDVLAMEFGLAEVALPELDLPDDAWPEPGKVKGSDDSEANDSEMSRGEVNDGEVLIEDRDYVIFDD